MKKPKLILNAGIYDLCHRGHLNLLRRMREAAGTDGKIVIVLHDDRSCFEIKDKIPVQSLDRRRDNLDIVGVGDETELCFNADPATNFESVWMRHRDTHDIVYMRGDDLTGDFPGRWMLDKIGVPIEFLPYTKGVSSSEIRKELEDL